MQLKGFLSGLAVASLLWLGVPAVADWAAPARSVSAQDRAQQNLSHAAAMQQQGQSMCPFQRKAQRNMARCPYSGQPQPGGYGHGNDKAGERGSVQGVRQGREPLET